MGVQPRPAFGYGPTAMMKRPACLLPALLFPALAACAPVPPPGPGPASLQVTATAIPLSTEDPARTRVGALEYRGGVHLASRDPRFGGLSGLRWHGGRLLAVSDAGDWLSFDVRESGERLTGVADVRIARLSGADGAPLSGKKAGDAEALELVRPCADGSCQPTGALVAFEQDHRLWAYDLAGGLASGRPRPAALPPAWLSHLPGNGGMEALASGEGVALIISESLRTSTGAAVALVRLGGGDWQEAEVPVAEGFSPTDAAHLGGREFLMLSRHYSLMHGVAARLDRLSVKVGEDGRPRISAAPVAAFAPPLSVDNMEGLAVRRESGRQFVYLLSDDNFSGLQRTLLMKFELVRK